MSEATRESAATPDRLEQAFENTRIVNSPRNIDGGPLRAFVGSEVMMNMGQHLLSHMRDEERWGGTNSDFAPIDFVLAATEVAHDHTVGESSATRIHIAKRLPARVTFDIFMDFWLPKVAAHAYGEEYGNEVSAILQKPS